VIENAFSAGFHRIVLEEALANRGDLTDYPISEES
jgi:hypothetical protein